MEELKNAKQTVQIGSHFAQRPRVRPNPLLQGRKCREQPTHSVREHLEFSLFANESQEITDGLEKNTRRKQVAAKLAGIDFLPLNRVAKSYYFLRSLPQFTDGLNGRPKVIGIRGSARTNKSWKESTIAIQPGAQVLWIQVRGFATNIFRLDHLA
jgi:hypothetical protein